MPRKGARGSRMAKQYIAIIIQKLKLKKNKQTKK